MSSFYAQLNKYYPDIQNPASILERISEGHGAPVDFLHYRDGNYHSTPTYRNGIVTGPECVRISKEDANKIFKYWKDSWFDANKELYEKRDEALARGDVVYYARYGVAPFNKMKPDGLLRKVQISPSHSFHEELRGNGTWYPTEFFRLYNLGHNDDDYEELTIAEAEKVLANRLA